MDEARTFQVRDAATGAVVVERATEAATFRNRLFGLLARPALRPGEGLWLTANGVHTFGMRYAIDAVVLDSDGRVLRVAPQVAPNRVVWPVRGGRVSLEIPAGQAAISCVTTGKRLVRSG